MFVSIKVRRNIAASWYIVVCKIKILYSRIKLMGLPMSHLPIKKVGGDTFIDNELVLYAEVLEEPVTDAPHTIVIFVKGVGLLWVLWSAGLENWLRKSDVPIFIRKGNAGVNLDEVNNIPQKFVDEAKADSDFIYILRNKL